MTQPAGDSLSKEVSVQQPPASRTMADADPATDEAITAQPSSEALGETAKRETAIPAYKEPQLVQWRFIVLIASMALGLFLSFLDTSIVATSLYTIGEEFDSLATVNWIALSYTLSYVGLAVVIASIGDVIGRRNAFLASSVIFIAFSLGCGWAQSVNQLIALRTFQGIGGAGLYSLTMVIFPEICPLRLMKWIGGIIGSVVAIAGVLGPVLGGLITNYTTWRWIFWINGPIGLLSMVPFYLAWPPADQLREQPRRSAKQIDFVGCFLLVAASVLVVFAFQEGGQGSGRWSSPLFLAPVIVGTICWILLFGWATLVARKWPDTMSIFPIRLLRNRVYSSTMLATILIGYPYLTTIFSLPTLFQVVYGRRVLIAGVSLLPMLGAAALGSMLGGAFSAKKNNSFFVLGTGSSFMVIGVGLLSTISPSGSIQAKTYGFEIFVGLGFGLTVSTASILANIESKIQDHAVSQGIIAQMRVLGGSIGIAASTAILGVTQRRELNGIVSPAQLESLRGSRGGGVNELTPPQLQAIRMSYADAFSETMRVCAIVSGISLLVTLGTFKRHREEMMEIKKRQFKEEMMRQSALAAAKGKGGGGPGTGTGTGTMASTTVTSTPDIMFERKDRDGMDV